MKIKLRYPLLAKAKAKNNIGGFQWMSFSNIAEFEVAEYTDEQMPIAIEFKEEHSKSKIIYRHYATQDELYEKLCPIRNLDKHWSEQYILSDKNPSSIYKDILLRKIHTLIEQGEIPNPNRFIRSAFPLMTDTAYLVSKNMIESAESDMQDILDNHFVVGKHLYRKAEEPIFHVYRTNIGWKTTLFPAPAVNPDYVQYNFSLDQYQDMVDWKEELTAQTNRPGTVDDFSMSGFYEAKRNGYYIDVDRLCQNQVFRVSRYITEQKAATSATWSSAGINSIPVTIIESYLNIRKYLDIPMSDRTPEQTNDILAELERFSDLATKLELDPHIMIKPSILESHIKKWLFQPININPIVSLPNKP